MLIFESELVKYESGPVTPMGEACAIHFGNSLETVMHDAHVIVTDENGGCVRIDPRYKNPSGYSPIGIFWKNDEFSGRMDDLALRLKFENKSDRLLFANAISGILGGDISGRDLIAKWNEEERINSLQIG